MTHGIEKAHCKRWGARPAHMGRTLCGLLALSCLFLLLLDPDTAIDFVRRGLQLCAHTVIPSLFPFMVLSEMIVAGDLGAAPLRRLSIPMGKLFRLSPAGCRAFLMGLLCGFPIGARCAVSAYDRGELTKAECERVLCFSGAPSSAFLISAVGVSLWGSHAFGAALYASVILASLITALLSAYSDRSVPHSSYDEYAALRSPALTGAPLLSHAVRAAIGGILSVSAYVILFSALTGTLESLLVPLALPTPFLAALTAFLELSSGVSQAASLNSVPFAAILTAAAAGWSGLSVHCQILAVTDGRALSLRPYFFAKLLQAFLTSAIVAILIYMFPALLGGGVG